MNNPWKEPLIKTKEGGYIAPCDEAILNGLPNKIKDKLQFKYQPQPYMGNPKKAKIFLLNGNPNAPDESGGLSHEKCNHNEECKKIILDSLVHGVEKCPLYAFNPAFRDYSIHKWWFNHLHFLTESGDTIETLGEKIFAAEFFPYFSDNLRDTDKIDILKTQRYTFSLIEEAIDKEKTIVIMRARDKWYDNVAGLRKYSCVTDRVIELQTKNGKPPQSAWVSRGNMKPGDFDKILNVLKEKHYEN